MQTVSENKRLLREICKNKRRSMEPSERAVCDKAVQTAAAALIEGLAPEYVLCYVSSLDTEVQTTALIEKLLSCAIKTAVPKSLTENYGLDFYLIDSLSSLKRGHYNILEPDTSLCRRVQVYEGVCIVPGLAFDRGGRRLGFGKGYYDRFLEKGSFITAGLCYECCVFDEIPHEDHDAVMDYLITEKGIIKQKEVFAGE